MRTAVADDPVADAEAGVHDALLYRSETEYVEGVGSFLEPAVATRGPMFIAVPAENAELLRAHLPDVCAAGVQFADMRVVGRNPARIIPAIQQFLDANRSARARFVGEPIWAGRSPAEICEATRHEAMLNTVFAGVMVDILCPYDVRRLSARTIADAWRTHPSVVDGSRRSASTHYGNPVDLYDPAEPIRPRAPRSARAVPIKAGQLPEVRDAVRGYATGLGLPIDRVRDLVLAVNEIATNTLQHSGGSGSLRIWHDGRFVTCEIRDAGRLSDPLVGRRRPDPVAARGRGLWMANQLCDLLQWRSGEHGVTVRLKVAHPSS